MNALDRIREAWRTGVLCDDDRCGREGPHFPGEYGCVFSDVAVYPSARMLSAMAIWSANRLWGEN